VKLAEGNSFLHAARDPTYLVARIDKGLFEHICH
jgi:hypothetical protein